MGKRWVYVLTTRKPDTPRMSPREKARGFWNSVRCEVIRYETRALVRMPDGEERWVGPDEIQPFRREVDPIDIEQDDDTRGSDTATVSRHPSFGAIGISHISGARAIHGSKLDSHQHWVEIRITRGAEEYHDLGRNWHHGGTDRVCTVALSGARFAELLSAPNRGSGVPCSLVYHSPIPGPGMIPWWPERDTEVQKIVDRVKNLGNEAKARQAKNRAEIEELLAGTSKKKRDAVLYAFDQASRLMNDSAPFLVNSAVEALESRVVEAKAEVESFVTSAIHSAGVEAIQQDPRKLLEFHSGGKVTDDGPALLGDDGPPCTECDDRGGIGHPCAGCGYQQESDVHAEDEDNG